MKIVEELLRVPAQNRMEACNQLLTTLIAGGMLQPPAVEHILSYILQALATSLTGNLSLQPRQ